MSESIMPLPIHGYVCTHNHHGRLEVYATTTLQAQSLAAAHWKIKPVKAYTIATVLCEKDVQGVTEPCVCKSNELPPGYISKGEQVVNTAVD